MEAAATCRRLIHEAPASAEPRRRGLISLREVLRMSEQRKNTGTRKRATKKDTENKTTRTRKKVAEEQAAPVQQNEEAAPIA